MSFTTSATLTQLINFLTRPLILTHPAITVAHLQLVLQANLSSFLPLTPATDASTDNKDSNPNRKRVLSPFTFHLSPHTLPIPPIYAGCLSSGISWEEWIRVLTAGLGNDVYVFIMEGCIRVGVPKTGNMKEGEQGLDMIELWREQEEKKSEPSPMALKLRATLNSVHARKAAAQASAPSTTTTATRTRSSSPDDSPSSTSSDVDYDSDNESTTSSSYSGISKFSSRSSESMTSVSSCSVIANDDDDEVKSNHPIYRRPSATLTTRAPAPTKTSTTSVLQPRQRAPRPTTPKTASAFAPRTPTPHNKAQSIKPQLIPTTTLRTLTQKSRYTYEGGETGIVTGGVMLGSLAATTATTITTLRSSGSKSAKQGTWRVSLSSKGTKNASATTTTTTTTAARDVKSRKRGGVASAASENWRRRV